MNVKYNDTLAAVDDVGRVLPIETANEKSKNRQVGLFYFLWCGEHDSPDGKQVLPYDVTKILASDKNAGYKPDSDIWGGYGVMHHWGEPLFGYYYSKDEWVMRRHVEMLTHANVDFLVIDTTNFLIYENNAKMLLRLLEEYRNEGFNTPKLIFYTNTRSGETVENLYNAVYKDGYMKNSWYYFEDKPLIIAKSDECSEKSKDFFTIRAAQWPNEPTKTSGWPWMDFERPQRVFYNENGESEIINVSVAQHPQIYFGDSALYGETANRGRNFHNGENDKSEDAVLYGYNFAEQWERALECNPPFVFVTGWNEWIMGRWNGSGKERPIGFVDCANIEYSRDCEPMRGGYFDNYYLQLINYIRKYKGVSPVQRENEKHSVNIQGDFSQWDKVTMAYRDFTGSSKPRNCEGYGARYTDNSGRNEVILSKAAHDDEFIYFYAQTTVDIDLDLSGSWLNLYINANGEKNYKGYDFIANYFTLSKTKTCLAKCEKHGEHDYKICGSLEYKCENNKFMIKIPKKDIGINEKEHFKIEFKWADSKIKYKNIEDFYTNGDTAPIGRLNYVFLV